LWRVAGGDFYGGAVITAVLFDSRSPLHMVPIHGGWGSTVVYRPSSLGRITVGTGLYVLFVPPRIG
ncbi:Hypothetical predicted protein, partial [Pelobates cultripes]